MEVSREIVNEILIRILHMYYDLSTAALAVRR